MHSFAQASGAFFALLAFDSSSSGAAQPSAFGPKFSNMTGNEAPTSKRAIGPQSSFDSDMHAWAKRTAPTACLV